MFGCNHFSVTIVTSNERTGFESWRLQMQEVGNTAESRKVQNAAERKTIIATYHIQQ